MGQRREMPQRYRRRDELQPPLPVASQKLPCTALICDVLIWDQRDKHAGIKSFFARRREARHILRHVRVHVSFHSRALNRVL